MNTQQLHQMLQYLVNVDIEVKVPQTDIIH
jgi:hypothetical protein